jgi:uncharacterized protein
MTYRTPRGTDSTVIWALIVANVAFYVATIFNSDLLYQYGLRPVLVGSRPWTLVTAMFLHGSVWHILGNMFTLYFFGQYLNVLAGWKWTLLVYFVGGILGNLLFTWMANLLGYPLSMVIGASGAVFALGGALAVLQPRARVVAFPIPVPVPLWAAIVGGFLIMSVISIWLSLNVAWEAHLGGLAFGALAGYIMWRRWRRPQSPRPPHR